MTGIDQTPLSQCSSSSEPSTTVMDLSMKSTRKTTPPPQQQMEKQKTRSNTSKKLHNCLKSQKRSLKGQQKFFRPWEREPRNCKLCPRKTFFSRKSDLQRHVKTKHSDENQNLLCQFCEETFTRKDNLTRHVKTMHSGDNEMNVKPNCRFCDKRLSRNDAVKRHEKSCKVLAKKALLKTSSVS